MLSAKADRTAFCTVQVAVAVLLVATMPRFIYPGDPVTIRESTRSLLQTGDISVEPQVAARLGERGQYFFYNEARDKWYSKYGLLNSVLYVPPLWAEQLVVGSLGPLDQMNEAEYWWHCLLLNSYNILVSLGISIYLFRISRLYARNPWICGMFVLSVLFGTFAWNYLRAQAVEIFQVFFFCGLYYHLMICRRLGVQRDEAAPSLGYGCHLWLVMVYLGLLVLQKLVFAVLMPVVALFLLLADHHGSESIAVFLLRRVRHDAARVVLHIVLPMLLIGGITMAGNWYRFGAPFNPGYTQWTPESVLFTSPWAGFIGYWADPQKSLPLYFPPLVLAAAGLWWFLRRWAFDWLFALCSFLTLYVACSCFVNWSGNACYGPRYLLAVLPVLSLPALALVDRRGNPSNSLRRIGLLLMVAALLWSGHNQWLINRLEFFTPIRSMFQFAELKSPEVAEYFRAPFWVNNGDLIAFRTGKGPFPPLQAARAEVPAPQYQVFENITGELAVGNLLFWDRDRRFREGL
jgi:hypothetical protein